MVNRSRSSCIALVLVSQLFGEDKLQKLIGPWAFQSMTTITKAAREEINILYKDDKNLETLTFEDSGNLRYRVLNDGIEKAGDGVWYSEDIYLTIIVDKDTTYGTFEIEGNTLSIIITEDETKDYYGYSTILKYISK